MAWTSPCMEDRRDRVRGREQARIPPRSRPSTGTSRGSGSRWVRRGVDEAPRPNLATLLSAYRETAWKALCARTEEVGKMKNARVWLQKAVSSGTHGGACVSVEPAPIGASSTMCAQNRARHTVRELAVTLAQRPRRDQGREADAAAGWKIRADRPLALNRARRG